MALRVGLKLRVGLGLSDANGGVGLGCAEVHKMECLSGLSGESDG